MSAESPFELHSQTLGALPIVCRFLERMRVGELLERYLGEPDPRCALAPARSIGLLIRNLIVCHEPLYRLGEWAQPFDPALLGLSTEEAALLGDDQVGRALDRLFYADRASLLTELMLGVISAFQVDCSQLHNDSTSISVHGAYRGADGHQSAGKATPRICHGHSKDHRPDLKQLLWILTVSADGAVPLAYRLGDGNTTDDQTHIQTWERLRRLVGYAEFLYVADCKLCTREQLEHLDQHGGRFVTVLPRSRKEDGFLRDWVQTNTPDWSEAYRKPGNHDDDPDQVWWTAPAPIPSAEGYRIIWVRSSAKIGRDAQARQDRIQRGLKALNALSERLNGARSRLRTRQTVEQSAAAALAHTGAERWIDLTIRETVQETYRQEKRGRPGKDTRYRKHTTTRFQLDLAVNTQTVAYDAATDGCFPLITNERQLTDAQILAAYRYQPNLEKRHHLLKTVQDAAPVLLKSPERIEALFCCHFIALLSRCLIERQLRQAMTRDQIEQLPMFPEQRACRQPTAERTLELFTGLARHHLTRYNRPVQTFPPELNPLQAQVLQLLDVPTAAYTP
jgi:transposase